MSPSGGRGMRAAGFYDGTANGRLDVNVGRVVGPPGDVLVGSDQQELVTPGVGRRSVEDAERDCELAGAAPHLSDRRIAVGSVGSVGSVAGVVGPWAQQGEAR